MVGVDWTMRLTGRIDMMPTHLQIDAVYLGMADRIVQVLVMKTDLRQATKPGALRSGGRPSHHL
jgi:hypothetical protein